MNMNDLHWVAAWGTATSISDRHECNFAKDITLRYPIFVPFAGQQIRLRLSNLTGTEPVVLTRVTASADHQHFVTATLGGKQAIRIEPGKEVETDPLAIDVEAGTTIVVSIYLGEATQMNAGTLVTGPLSGGQFAYGDHSLSPTMPDEMTRGTNWYWFVNTLDILTSTDNHAVICYGDSITAQSWPDYLAQKWWKEGRRNLSVVRRAVCGTRILRQYDCATYAAYGLKGATRFPIESRASGATDIIIQHGINDIIHPVGTEVNRWRPWSDLPTVDEMIEATTHLYIEPARAMGMRVHAGTLLPIYGWRTYNEMRDEMRNQFNQWLRTSELFDSCIDFDRAVCDPEKPERFAPGFDSGDHLHPSEAAYARMAEEVAI